MEHDFWGKIVPNGLYFGQGEDFKLTTETVRKGAIFPQTSNQKQLKWSNTAYVNKWSFAFKIKLSQVNETKFYKKMILTVPKFAISQSEAKSNVLISYDIKSLTWYPAISWSLSSKVMLPYDKLQRGFANKQTTRNLRFSWCFAVKRRRKNLSRQN